MALEKAAALYIRVSTDKQEELSPDAQKRLGIDFAKQHGYFIDKNHIYVENGISGRKADKRPQFMAMISAAKSKPKPFDVILVWKFSRFARNQEESIVYKSLLKKQCDIEVVSISEPLIDGPFGSLIERIIEWMDEYYSIRLSGEVRRGMTEKALRGGYNNGSPLGYTHGNPPEINPDTAKIIHFIFDEYTKHGAETTAIARKLNENGCRTLRNGLFEKRTVAYILQNPFYMGKIRWNRICKETGELNDEDEVILSDGIHSPIISAEQFQQAQERCRSEFKPVKRRGVTYCKHWLSGLLKCPICGANLAYNHGANGVGFFNCWKYAKGVHKESCSVTAKKIERIVLDGIKEVLDSGTIEFAYRQIEEQENTLQDLLQDELKKMEIKKQRIRLSYENGIDTLEEYAENKKRIQKEELELLEKIKECSHPEPARIPSDQEALKKLSNVYDILIDPDIGYIQKGEMLRSIVEKIVYNKPDSTVDFFFYMP